MVRKVQSKRLSNELSIMLRIKHQDFGIPVMTLANQCRKYFDYSTIHRHCKRKTKILEGEKSKITKRGRSKKITVREERATIRSVKEARSGDGTANSKRMQFNAGLKHICNISFRNILKKHGYRYLQARKKELMSKKDKKHRKKFAQKMIKTHSPDVWLKEICLYLNGSSSVHKTNPADQTRTSKAKLWRKSCEGLLSSCTAKGSKIGNGGSVFCLNFV